MANIVLFGAGLIGQTIAKDLSELHTIQVIDSNQDNLDRLPITNAIQKQTANAMDVGSIARYVRDSEIVIGALPGHLGFNFLQKIIPLGKPIVDISFFPEDPFQLETLAHTHQIPVAIDCGLAPGMSNIFCGHFSSVMDVKKFKCMVGGLPQNPKGFFKYKAVFSPRDVLEEYTRPARLVENGKTIIKDALTDIETVTVKKVGKLESFNTDGLRTLLKTMSIPTMLEKTIRYADTTKYLLLLKELGYLSDNPIEIGDTTISPLEITSQLLLPHWKLEDEDRDVTVMKIVADGTINHDHSQQKVSLIDYYDENNKTTSMARTTGFTCTAIVNLILQNKWNKTGLIPPEYFGMDEVAYQFILNYLHNRGVDYQTNT